MFYTKRNFVIFVRIFYGAPKPIHLEMWPPTILTRIYMLPKKPKFIRINKTIILFFPFYFRILFYPFYLQEFSVNLFQPLIRLLSTVKPFSTGVITKKYLSRKVVDILGLFCQKLKREYAQEV